jgi:hypothetical protein
MPEDNGLTGNVATGTAVDPWEAHFMNAYPDAIAIGNHIPFASENATGNAADAEMAEEEVFGNLL